MQFRTPINKWSYGWQVGHTTPGLLLGSCFAEHIGERMLHYKLPVTVNPFGILFNPASISEALERFTSGQRYETSDLIRHGDVWASFDHHSSLSSTERQEALKQANQALQTGHQALQRSEYLIITLGTAWVYEHIETGRIVTNCHKHPAREFRRRRLSAEEITTRFTPLLEGTLSSKKILWSVSPVRHLSDGLVENALSKSTLLVAVHQLVERYKSCDYFPAFEIVNDDLRDYRFYEKDMVHPNETAISYIWEHFCDSFVEPAAQELFGQLDDLHRAMQHRPFHPESATYQTFLHRKAAEVNQLQRQHPELDLSAELHFFEL